jgi:hypothetical protein
MGYWDRKAGVDSAIFLSPRGQESVGFQCCPERLQKVVQLGRRISTVAEALEKVLE